MFVDNVEIVGHFTIKAISKDGSVEEYSEKNLIVDGARNAMASAVGGDGDSVINKFVLGNKGHDTSILDYLQVGETGPEGTFNAQRENLFSQSSTQADKIYYEVPFNVQSAVNPQTDATATGTLFTDGSSAVDATPCSITRNINARTVTYTIIIPAEAGNVSGDVVAYTEAALYAGSTMFSMKTFPARVKEDSVRFEISWSINF